MSFPYDSEGRYLEPLGLNTSDECGYYSWMQISEETYVYAYFSEDACLWPGDEEILSDE